MIKCRISTNNDERNQVSRLPDLPPRRVDYFALLQGWPSINYYRYFPCTLPMLPCALFDGVEE